MKKLIIIFILSYLLSTINSNAADENTNTTTQDDTEVLKIGVLIPLTGEFKEIGRSVLNTVKLALFDLGKKNIKIYPKDSKGTALGAYIAAQKFSSIGIKIVLGPIFHKSLSKLNKIENITFLSLTNKTEQIPKNTITLGINIDSQLKAIKKYLDDNNFSKTLLLIPKSEFEDQITTVVQNNKFNFYKIFSYDTNPKNITNEIEKITFYQERKRDLERRIKILEDSNLEENKRELDKLKQKYTLGKVDFDSVIIADFGERLKSVLTSFRFSDVTNKDVSFFTLNQWFDESLFYEDSMENLFFPSINQENFNEFRKRYFDIFNHMASEISVLAYDGTALIYYAWINNKTKFNMKKLQTVDGFKGYSGHFMIKNNLSYQKLNIYKIFQKNFEKVN